MNSNRMELFKFVAERTRHTAPGRTLYASSARLNSSKWARWMGLRHWNATASVSGGRLARTSAAVWQGNTLRRDPRPQHRGQSGVGNGAVCIVARAAWADLTGGIRQKHPKRCGCGAPRRHGAERPLMPPRPFLLTARRKASLADHCSQSGQRSNQQGLAMLLRRGRCRVMAAHHCGKEMPCRRPPK